MAVSIIVMSLRHGRMSAIDVITLVIVALTVVIAITSHLVWWSALVAALL